MAKKNGNCYRHYNHNNPVVWPEPFDRRSKSNQAKYATKHPDRIHTSALPVTASQMQPHPEFVKRQPHPDSVYHSCHFGLSPGRLPEQQIGAHPRIFITPSSAKGETSTKAAPHEGREPPISFFGHHIGKLLDPDKAADEDFISIDKELESSLETVQKKLRMIKGPSPGESRISEEEIKHRHFIEERNKAQEALFDDIVRFHGEFETGLNSDELLSLHELMQMEAAHEKACSREESIHELVECNLLTFLRRKAQEQAWQKLEDNIVRFHIEFPIPPSMVHRADPVRKEKVTEERKKSAQDEFLTKPAQQLAELILGNVPIWVYSYPGKETYLWKLTLLQGVAAGLAGNLLMKYLSVWEENSTEILNRIQQDFMERIDELHRRGRSAINLAEVLSISKELERISREQMPEDVWKYICSKLEVAE